MPDVVILDRDPAALFLTATYRAAQHICSAREHAPGTIPAAVIDAYATLPRTGEAITAADPLVFLLRQPRTHEWVKSVAVPYQHRVYGLPVLGDPALLPHLGRFVGIIAALAVARQRKQRVPESALTLVTCICADDRLTARWDDLWAGTVIDAMLTAHPHVAEWATTAASEGRAALSP